MFKFINNNNDIDILSLMLLACTSILIDNQYVYLLFYVCPTVVSYGRCDR